MQIPQGSILGLTFSYFTLTTSLMMLSVILLSILMDTTIFSKCDQASDLWQQFKLVSELESNLQDTVDQCKKYLVHFSAGKTQMIYFDWSNNTSNNNNNIDVKVGGSVLEEKSSFKKLG